MKITPNFKGKRYNLVKQKKKKTKTLNYPFVQISLKTQKLRIKSKKVKTWVNPSLSCVSINVNAAAELIATVEAISIDFDEIPSLMMILWRSRWARLGYELVERGLPTLFVVGVGVGVGV